MVVEGVGVDHVDVVYVLVDDADDCCYYCCHCCCYVALDHEDNDHDDVGFVVEVLSHCSERSLWMAQMMIQTMTMMILTVPDFATHYQTRSGTLVGGGGVHHPTTLMVLETMMLLVS